MSRASTLPSTPVLPPATLGILGGGQLGRYFVMAAHSMGYRTIVLEPDPFAPAGAAADVHLVAAYDDPDALATMMSQCAVVTTEFENAPAATMSALATATLVRPSAQAIEITQDRRLEKRFLESIGVPVAPFAVIESDADLAAPGVGFPALLKTARLGYDGLGQIPVSDPGDVAAAWLRLDRVPCVLEQRMDFDREVSVVLARGVDGVTAAYPAVANVHVGGILDLTIVPDTGPGSDTAIALARSIADALDYVGVLSVEFFVVDGHLIVNELAPRPHNSGHWTLNAAATSQFEQQVRAICGLPLGDTTLMSGAAAMANLLGDMWLPEQPDWYAALADRRAHLHLYGKLEPRSRRKMGHLTVVAATRDQARRLVIELREHARFTRAPNS